MDGRIEQVPDALRTELELFWKQVYNVSAMLKTLAEQLRAARQGNRKLEAQLNEYHVHLGRQEEQIRSLEEQVQQLQFLQQKLSQSQDTIEQLKRAITERDRLLLEREQELRQSSSIRAELESLQRLYAQQTEDYCAVQQTLENTNELQAEIQRLRSRVAELEHERLCSIAEQEELAYLRSKVEQLHAEHNQALAQLEQHTALTEELAQLRDRTAEAEQIIAQLEAALESKRAELEHLASRYSEAELALTVSASDESIAERQVEFEQQLRLLREENEQLRHQCATYAQKIAELQHLLEERSSQLIELRTALDESHPQERVASAEEIVRLRREVELRERTATQQRHQMELLTDEVTHLREQLRFSQQSQQDVELRIAEAIAPLHIEIEAAGREREKLQEQIRTQRERIHQLESELGNELEQNALLQRRLRQFEHQPSVVQTLHLTEQLERLVELLQSLRTSDTAQDLFPTMDLVEMLLGHIREILQASHAQQFDPAMLEAIRQARELLQQRLAF